MERELQTHPAHSAIQNSLLSKFKEINEDLSPGSVVDSDAARFADSADETDSGRSDSAQLRTRGGRVVMASSVSANLPDMVVVRGAHF